MSQKIIVDGYNVLHLIESYRSLLQTDLESARNRLIHDLIVYRSHKKIEITVVFDGAIDIPVQGRNQRRGGIMIVFSRAPQKADPVIIDLIKKDMRSRSIIVVSNDREITDFAKSEGAQSISPAEFYERMTAKSSDIQLRNKVDGEISGEELDEWKKIFGID